METAAVHPGEAQWRRSHAPGLVVGVLALATAWFAIPVVTNVPFGGLVLNLALAWGAYALIEVGIHRRPAPHSLWVPALAPWLAAPMLLRMHLVAMHEDLPTWVATTWTLEGLSVAFGVGAVLAYRHLLDELASTKAALACSGLIGSALAIVFVLLHLSMPTPAQAGALAIFGLTAVGVAGIVFAQHALLRSRRHPVWRAVAGGAALAVTVSQMLDGIVTYLAVVDPFRLLERPMTEQMAVSAWLLENTGVGYPVAKLALALTVSYLLERGWRESAEPVAKRTGLYLGLILVGFGPALYSTASLLS